MTSKDLDLYSTSQTGVDQTPTCAYKAPYIVYPTDMANGQQKWNMAQGNCHHWDCPRCGPGRARQEYRRIVEGVKTLSDQGHDLWFITLTCRGRDMTLQDAEAGYLKWTNRINTTMRTRAKRSGKFWSYVAVTERQKRGHPHSHMLTTWAPEDTAEYTPLKVVTAAGGLRLVAKGAPGATRFVSDWLSAAAENAGLGPQVDISKVETPDAVSRYVAKYLFKDAALTAWPSGWKRVRYSQSFPKPEDQPNPDAFPIIKPEDWRRLESLVKAGNTLHITNDPHLAKVVLNRGIAVYHQSTKD